MAKYDGTKVTIGLVRSPRQFDDFSVNSHETYTIDLSGVEKISDSEITKVVADTQMIDSILRDHRADVVEIMDDVLVGRREHAKEKGRKIGLEEKKFIRGEGGVAWWIVALLVIAMMTCDATCTPERAY
ncbi:hypothetical protein ACFLVO_01565 [Chloroflexota bacterium]